MSKTLREQLVEESEKYDSMDEDQQNEAMAENVLKLTEILPDPSNEKEFNEFLNLLKDPPIHGDNEAEIMSSFLELSNTNPKFFAQVIAFVTLTADADTLGNLAKTLTPKKAKVESISSAELQAIHNEDEAKRVQEIKDELASISVD